MEYYRRNLPHWQPIGAEYFITFRLAGTLPFKAISKLKDKQRQFKLMSKKSGLSPELRNKFEAEIFQFYDQLLDNQVKGPTWLSNKNIAQTIIESIYFYNQSYYELYAYTIMSNHVHLIFRHLEKTFNVDLPVTAIMKNIKSYTGKKANQILKRKGKFWQAESYDRVIRDNNELENKIRYTLNNPVKAGLISDWREWPYTYCKPEFIQSF